MELDTRYGKTTDFLERHASEALMEATNVARRITAEVRPTLEAADFDAGIKKPSMQPPPKFSDLFPDGDSTAEEVKRLNNQVDEWVENYFPSINGCFKNVPDEWLCNIITNKNPFGLHESVFESIWQQARDKEHRTFMSDERSLRSALTERGFSVPPGAYVQSLSDLHSRGQKAIHDVIREEAIRNEEVKLQLLQFAVGEANQYKMSIMSSLSDFYRSWVSIPDKDIERAKIRSQAQSALYSALSSYYNVEVAFEGLKVEEAKAKASSHLQHEANKIDLYGSSSAASALGNAVRGFSQISGDAANAAGSLIAQIESL